MRYGSLIIAAALFGSTPLPAAKLDVRQGHPVVHGIFVNGSGPYRFLLDTGAQSNQIHAGLARSLGIAPTFQVELVTATGSARTPGTRGLEVAVDSAKADQQEFLFTDLDAVRQLDSGIQGVLGQAFLSRFDYLLDLRAKRLEFGSAPRPGTRVKFQWIDGRPTLVTSLGSLVLDSGTDHVVLFQTGSVPPTATLRTATGFLEAGVLRSKPLVIEGRTLRYDQAISVPRQPGVREDGLLPAALFRSVYVSNSERYLVLDSGFIRVHPRASAAKIFWFD